MAVLVLFRRILGVLAFTETVMCDILMFAHVGSHFQTMSILAEELCERGYNVTMVAPDLCFKQKRFCFNAVSFPLDVSELPYFNLNAHSDFARSTLFPAIGEVNFRGMLKQSDVIYKVLGASKFKMAIVDSALVDALAFVTKLKLPHIIFAASRFDIHLAKFSDASLSPSVVPVGRRHYAFSNTMTFFQRAANNFFYIYQRLTIQGSREGRKLMRDNFMPELYHFDTDMALRNTTLWIVNSDFNLEFPYPVMPNVKYTGGLSVRPAAPLSQELDEFVNGNGNDGIILINFSTLMTSGRQDVENLFLEACSSFPQRVLWRGETTRVDSDKVKFVTWMNQNDVLGSKKVRVFVTNGGINGIQEAMYHGVTMVILPVLGDQPDNAVRVETRGYGVTLDPFNLTLTSIVHALNAAIYEDRFRKKLQSVSEVMQFQYSHCSGRKMAAYWVEHAMKYGHNYIEPGHKELSYLQCHSLDLLAVSVGVLLLMLFVLLNVSKIILKALMRIYSKLH